MTAYDVEDYLREQGWSRARKQPAYLKDQVLYQKRYGSIWVQAFLDTSYWSDRLLVKAPVPKGVSHGDFMEVAKKLTRWVPYTELGSLDRQVKELLGTYKELGGARRRQRDVSDIQWREFRGEEAIQRWSGRVEEILLEDLQNSYRRWERMRQYQRGLLPGQETHSLAMNVLDNYRELPRGMSRPAAQKAIRRLLDVLVRKGKVFKDTNDPRKPLWEWVP